MARTNLPVAQIDRGGVGIGSVSGTEVAGDTVNKHEFVNDGSRTFISVRNADGAATHDVTFTKNAYVDGVLAAARTETIAISGHQVFGPFGREYLQSGADAGKTFLEVDSAQLKLQVFKL